MSSHPRTEHLSSSAGDPAVLPASKVPDDELGRLQAALGSTFSHAGLVSLEAEARRIERAHAPSPHMAALIGATLRQRLEWEAASRYLLQRAADFPGELGLRYDAALTAIDAGTYDRGQALIEGLAPHLDRLDDRQLRGLWRAAPLVGLHGVAHAAFRAARGRGVAPCAPDVEGRLATAEANEANPVLQGVGVVSVGENCLPWHLGQRWGLRPRATMFQQESPFNLAQTTTGSVAALLNDGLDRLIAPELLSVSTAADGTSRPLNLTYQFDFNHERGGLFTDGGYAGLIARYSARIAALRHWLAGAPCVYLHYAERDGDLPGLARAIEDASPHGQHILLILDVWDGARAAVPGGARVRYARFNLPHPDYQWFRPDHWDEERGIAFERAMQAAVLDAAAELVAGPAPG